MADLARLGHRQELEAVEVVAPRSRYVFIISAPFFLTVRASRDDLALLPVEGAGDLGAALLGHRGLLTHRLQLLHERLIVGQLLDLLGRRLGGHREADHLAELRLQVRQLCHRPLLGRAELDPVREPRGEGLGEPPLAHLRLRLLDRVAGSAEPCPAGAFVNLEPRGARVAVARLPDRAGVEQQPVALRARAPFRRAPGRRERRAGADAIPSATWLCPTSTSGAEVAAKLVAPRRRSGRSPRSDRVGCRGRAARPRPRRAARASRGSRARRLEHARRPPRSGRRLADEGLALDLAEHDEVVVPGQADAPRARARARRTRSAAARSRRRRRGTRARPRRPRRSPPAPPRGRADLRECRR